jgi:hypothetical protein
MYEQSVGPSSVRHGDYLAKTPPEIAIVGHNGQNDFYCFLAPYDRNIRRVALWFRPGGKTVLKAMKQFLFASLRIEITFFSTRMVL